MQDYATRLTPVISDHHSANTHSLPSQQSTAQQLNSYYEASECIQWWHMNPSPRPCFNPQLLKELQNEQRRLMRDWAQLGDQQPQYIVAVSDLPGVFNLGGDLSLFKDHILAGNSAALRQYARTCVDLCYYQATNLDLPLTTIALVQGDALGGGFEAVLSNSIIIAEEQSQFGLPEVLFNLFPGMGAFSFLARRLDPVRAERLITSGKIYSAEDMYEMGIVDVVANQGDGFEAVYNFIARHKKSHNTRLAMQRVKQQYNPLKYDELIAISDIWTEAAMNLSERDLKLMERLVRAQNRRTAENTSVGDVTYLHQQPV